MRSKGWLGRSGRVDKLCCKPRGNLSGVISLPAIAFLNHQSLIGSNSRTGVYKICTWELFDSSVGVSRVSIN